ncbi:MAG TPA: hypothetical protein DEE98_02695 [Elusimicrobia bacterium]|nr:MAG: hypothetical protein A2278_07525 [Elusimicrobia bacterium RIFOXYA12_FULL_49_49]OGS10334.1 MAG: hypothetical protein A2204_07395 [Elusimicrobia bacterium RIFOXYA1_FULL_47_7]OGS11112.1 MAG: hypothetical protein A2386_05820 [Elusimicrobia bacterium RIFOXYB1_FULL_48_9]OGS16084.1 MAG: hypothetical protein A2251_02740 [Elusimicrobia bacterium RIFOXYA2_FULL_47_53]OGS26710.1 MAG: hypothetical protein A2339_03790 [Elusimicrobia bacterium RIFOXYB12_FULL_50_12]OGS30164.1 MAG: hypothetical protein
MTEHYSLQQIKQSFTQKIIWEKQFPVSYYLFRPVSFYAAYLILRITHSPSRVAFAGLFIGMTGNISFLFMDKLGIFAGIVLLMLCALSDAVDGNIARTTKNVTYYGKYLDSVLGAVAEGSFPFFLGAGLYLYNTNSIYLNPLALPDSEIKFLMLLCGSVIMGGIVFSNKIAETYDYQRIQKEKDSNGFKHEINAQIGTSTFSGNIFYLVFVNLHAFNLQLLFLLICALLNIVDVFMFVFASYYLFRIIFNLTFYTHRAGARLNK